MKNRKNTTTLMALILTIGLLSACALSEETLENNIVNMSTAIEGSDQSSVIESIEKSKKSGMNKELNLTQEVHSESVLQLEHEVGNIEVTASSSDKINVTATIWTLNSSFTKQHQEILDNAEVSVIMSGNKLNVMTHPKGNSKQNLWKWAEKEYGVSDLSIDYKIELPASINRFKISSEVGNIKLSNLNGLYQVTNHVGTVHVEKAQIKGMSSLQSEAGSLQLDIQQMEDGSSLKAKTEVGSIHATLADSLQISLTTDSEIGNIAGAPKGKSNINGGGPKLSLATSVGSITVENLSTAQLTKE